MHLEGPNTQIKAQMHLEMQTCKFQMHSLTFFSVYFFLLFFLLFSFFFNCCSKLSGKKRSVLSQFSHLVLPLWQRELQNTFSLTHVHCLVTHLPPQPQLVTPCPFTLDICLAASLSVSFAAPLQDSNILSSLFQSGNWCPKCSDTYPELWMHLGPSMWPPNAFGFWSTPKCIWTRPDAFGCRMRLDGNIHTITKVSPQ